MPTAEEVIAVLNDAVMCEPGTITPQSDLSEVPGWDSSSAVYFVGEAIGRWQAELSAQDLRECTTVPQLVERVNQRTPKGGQP